MAAIIRRIVPFLLLVSLLRLVPHVTKQDQKPSPKHWTTTSSGKGCSRVQHQIALTRFKETLQRSFDGVRDVQRLSIPPLRRTCSGPIVWFLVAGHFRSFETKLPNFRAFVEPAGCFILIFYLRHVYENSAETSLWKVDDQENITKPVWTSMEYIFNSEPWFRDVNYAYATVIHDNIAGQRDCFEGVHLLQTLTEEAMCRGASHAYSDVFVRTRPDLLFSHTLDYNRLLLLASELHKKSTRASVETRIEKHRGFAFYLRADTQRFYAFDPSEALIISSRSYFTQFPSGPFTRHGVEPVDSCCFSNLNSTEYTPGQDCTWHGQQLIFGPNRLFQDTYFIREGFRVHFLRLNTADYTHSNPINGNIHTVHPLTPVLGTFDVTKGALHMIGGLDSHCFQTANNELNREAQAFYNLTDHAIICFPNVVKTGVDFSNGSCGKLGDTYVYASTVDDALTRDYAQQKR